jgi:3-oxoacyl-[acyl-carrier protein] reductase
MPTLSNKIAVVFGAGGSIGAAVSKEFAAQGAEVFVSGRTMPAVEAVAEEIKTAGGLAHAERVDAVDEAAVAGYISRIAREKGTVDVAFNAMGPQPRDYGNGTNAVDLPVEEFMLPLTTIVKSSFIIARAAAREMVKQHSGVILFLTGSPARGHVSGAAAIGAAFGAIETFMENLAFEIGSAGVRAVCLRTTANVDSGAIRQTIEILSDKLNVPRDHMISQIAGLNFLKTPARIGDTAKAAAFLVSDHARLFTGTVVNSTAGAAMD